MLKGISKVKFLFIILFLTAVFGNSSFGKINLPFADSSGLNVRFEHLALNVADPVKVANWYKENLGLKIIRQGGEPNFTTFISDQDGNMMFEFFFNKDYPIQKFTDWNYMSIHMAFHCSDITLIKEKLVSAGAAIAEELKKTDSGDQVIMLRDPWGFPIQFVQRVNKMLNHEGLFFEHLAFNLLDSREEAKWLTENLGMKVKRAGKAPNYGMFISDAGENMMLELYQQNSYPVIKLDSVSHMTIHLAFMVSDIEIIKEKLLKAGAKIVEDITKSPGGDFLLMLRDRSGLPLQFVKRANPMVK